MSRAKKTNNTVSTLSNFQDIPVDKIVINETFKRFNTLHDKAEYKTGLTELAQSIKVNGLLEPILVFHDEPKDVYILHAGRRRLEAVVDILKEKTITAHLMKTNNIMAAVVENLQRVDLTTFERGQWIIIAADHMITTKEAPDKKAALAKLAKIFGKQSRTLYDWTRQAETLTDEQKAAVKSGKAAASKVLADSRKGKKNKDGSERKVSKGQEVKSISKRFKTLSDQITERISYIGTNAAEFKTDPEISVHLERLKKYTGMALEKINS